MTFLEQRRYRKAAQAAIGRGRYAAGYIREIELPAISALRCMSDQEIRELLREVNSDPEQCILALTPLNETVFHAEVLNHMELSLEGRGGPKARPMSFYLIRSDDGRFVGAVQDAVGDFHWYIVRPYRGQGLMSAALRGAVLPHIAASGRTLQRITISRGIGRAMFAASQRLALSVGFQLLNGPEEQVLLYELNLTTGTAQNVTQAIG